MFHCRGVFGSDFFCGPVVLIFGYRRWFHVCSPSFLSSFEHLLEIFGLVQVQVQERLFSSLSFVSSALTSISSMSRRSSLEFVAGARRPSSVSTSSDIFVAVLSR